MQDCIWTTKSKKILRCSIWENNEWDEQLQLTHHQDSTKSDCSRSYKLLQKGEATYDSAHTRQVIELSEATNYCHVGQGSYHPIEAQWLEHWGQPMNGNPRRWHQLTSLRTNSKMTVSTQPIKRWLALMRWQNEPMTEESGWSNWPLTGFPSRQPGFDSCPW